MGNVGKYKSPMDAMGYNIYIYTYIYVYIYVISIYDKYIYICTTYTNTAPLFSAIAAQSSHPSHFCTTKPSCDGTCKKRRFLLAMQLRKPNLKGSSDMDITALPLEAPGHRFKMVVPF